jgi:hypothetical protein
MSGPAYLDLPVCRRCSAAAVFPTGNGLYGVCIACKDHRVIPEEDHEQAKRAMAAWKKEPAPTYSTDQCAHELFIEGRIRREREKLERLREGRW